MGYRAMRITKLLAKGFVFRQLAAKVRCSSGSFTESATSSATAPRWDSKHGQFELEPFFTTCQKRRNSSGPQLQKPACMQKIPSPLQSLRQRCLRLMGSAEENSAALMLAATVFTTPLLLTSAAYGSHISYAPRRHGSPSEKYIIVQTPLESMRFLPQCRRAGWPRVAQAHDESRANRRRYLVSFKQILRSRVRFNDNVQ